MALSTGYQVQVSTRSKEHKIQVGVFECAKAEVRTVAMLSQQIYA